MEISVGINPEFCTTFGCRGIELIKRWQCTRWKQGEFWLCFALLCSPARWTPAGSLCAALQFEGGRQKSSSPWLGPKPNGDGFGGWGQGWREVLGAHKYNSAHFWETRPVIKTWHRSNLTVLSEECKQQNIVAWWSSAVRPPPRVCGPSPGPL